MAIRIRRVKNKNTKGGFSYIALCAAENKCKKGDVYLGDAVDHALRMKFLEDYTKEQKLLNKLYDLGLAPFRGYYEELLERENNGVA